MSSFLDDVKTGLLGTDYFRDFEHGSRVFRSGTMALAPRLKFLYHTYFTINPSLSEMTAAFGRTRLTQVGLMTKSFQLPNFNVQTETLNQYNRARVVQTGVKYQPVTITLHDDGSDVVRSLWRQYYAYYYGDSRGSSPDVGRRGIYENTQNKYSWGYSGEALNGSGTKPPFFSDITVYGFNQKQSVGYRLVNPTIASWQHDTFDYSETGGTLEHQVSVEYEWVEYLDQTAVPGFGDPASYDNAPSPLGQAGSTSSILGPGGVLDSIGDTLGALASGDLFEAALNAARTASAAKKITGAGVREERKGLGRDAARGLLGPLSKARGRITGTLF